MSKLSAAFRKLTGTKLSDVFGGGGLFGGGKSDSQKAKDAENAAKNAGFFGNPANHTVIIVGVVAVAAVVLVIALKKK